MAGKQPRKAIQVLLIEDDIEDSRLVKWALSRAQTKFEVEHVACLADAVEWLRIARFDVIVADLALPDTSRSDTVGRIHGQAPNIPVVVLTGLADDDAALAALDQGAEDYLVKDRITPEVLDKAIRYAIQRQRNAEIRGLLDKMRASERLLEKRNRRLARLYKFAHHSVDDVSHEFRTPLTVITEYVSLLRDGIVGSVNPEQSRMLNIVADRADDLNNMVNDMLDVSKLKSGLLGLYRESCSIVNVIDHVRPSLERKAAIRGAKFTVEIEDELPLVYCDPEKVGRVIINLTVNAIKFCGDPGEVRLWARFDAGTRQVVIGISNNGPGIDAHRIKNIFKRFNQSKTERRTGTKGFGLGLNIARQLVDLNLGKLLVDSQRSVVTTFSFTLPIGELTSVVPPYLHRLKRGIHRSPVASVVTATIASTTDDALADDVNAFLSCAVRPSDLVFRIDGRRWIVILPSDGAQVDEFVARAKRLHEETNRNRPHGPLPDVEFCAKGTWPVAGKGQKLLDELQSLVGSPPPGDIPCREDATTPDPHGLLLMAGAAASHDGAHATCTDYPWSNSHGSIAQNLAD